MIAALALALALPTSPLPWIHDDWATAKKQAIAAKKLVAVDVWATWCHTCLSMKNYTLKEPPLAKVAEQHVWLQLDYDLPVNAAFFGAFPIGAFPTFLVVDPAAEKVVARWVGSGTAEQMAEFFGSAKLESADPLSLGARALAAKDAAGARKIYEAALLAEKDPSKVTRLYNGLLEALSELDPRACVERGLEAVAKTEDTAPGIDAVLIAADCAERVDDAALAAKLRDAATARLGRASLTRLAPDDQSGVFATLASLYEKANEPKKSREATERRLAILEAAAKSAKDVAQRATFDAHRLECYLKLERYAAAEEMLKASEAAMPKDYNPPARLALLYRAQKKPELALAAVERALALGYGPRRLRLHSTKIDLLIDQKRWPEATAAIAAARADIAKIDPKLVRRSWTKALDAQEATVTEASARRL